VDPDEIQDIIMHSTIMKDLGNNQRKKREELSVSAVKCIKKENVKVVMQFSA